MIHIVTSDNRHLYGPQLWAMHEQRRLRCVEKNGWVDPGPRRDRARSPSLNA